MKFYLVGIKGSGMSSLANILVDLGHEVRGVDYPKKCFTEFTFRKNIVIDYLNNYTLKEDYFYIIGNVFKHTFIAAKINELGYRYKYYPEFIESFFTMPKIGISGSHGKTTTTKFIAQLLSKKKNVLIGDGNGYGEKDAKYLLLEACEYQNTFLNYSYEYLIVLNIDYDHPDYFVNEKEYINAFQKACNKAKILIINNDDFNCKKISHHKKVTFGYSVGSDVRILEFKDGLITLKYKGIKQSFKVPFNGVHFAYDFTAALIASIVAKTSYTELKDRARKLKFPIRRLSEYTLSKGLIVFDDYAHHPTEIHYAISSVKEKYPDKKIIAIFEPHTYSRTEKFLEDYIHELKSCDRVYLMPIFSSLREEEKNDKFPINRREKSFLKYDDDAKKELMKQENSVLLFMGAGDISNEISYFL